MMFLAPKNEPGGIEAFLAEIRRLELLCYAEKVRGTPRELEAIRYLIAVPTGGTDG